MNQCRRRIVTVLGLVAVMILGSPAVVAAPQPQAKPDTLIELSLHTSLLQKLVQLPISKRQPVCEQVSGAWMNGETTTTGLSVLVPWVVQSGLGACLRVTTETVGSVSTTQSEPMQINVQTDANITINGLTHRCFVVSERGITPYNSTTNASARIDVTNMQIWADGLFWRLKEAFAQDAAEEQMADEIAKSEYEASVRAANQMNVEVDSQTEPFFAKANQIWNDYVVNSLLRKNILGAGLGLKSYTDSIHVAVTDKGDDWKPQFVPTQEQPIVVVVDGYFLERLFTQGFGGAVLSDVEILDAVRGQTQAYSTIEQATGEPDELLIELETDNAIKTIFDANKLTIDVRVKSLQIQNQRWQNATIRLAAGLRTDSPGNVVVSVPDRVSVVDSASGSLIEDASSSVSQRFTHLFRAGEFSLNELLPTMAPRLKYRLVKGYTKNSKLILSMAPTTTTGAKQ